MWLLTGKTLYFFTVLLSGSGSVTGRGSIVENVVDISHSLDLDHLDQLTSSDLQQWLNTRKDHGTKFPLDALYRQQKIFQKRQTNDEL